jgi:RNA polymerase sigma factor (sigma-70 family)
MSRTWNYRVPFRPGTRTLIASVGGDRCRRIIGWGSDVTTALSNWDIVSDADLARAAAAGDRRAFAMIYDRYADRLHDFCVGMVRDRDAAADCVQDVFCTAASQLPKLREPDRLRPWLYAIARNEALRCIRDRRREQASDELPDAASLDAGPDTLAARTELAELIAQAAGGLSDRDRTVLELAYRHGLDGPELASALEVSPGTANKMVSRLRETIETSLGALLVARRAQHTARRCTELAAILADWDGHFSVLMRKRIGRHIESCPACEEERRRLVSPVALLGAAPILIPAPAWLRDQTLGEIKLTSAGHGLSQDSTAGHDAQSADTAQHDWEPDGAGYPDDAYHGGDDGYGDDAGQSRVRRVIPWIALFASIFFLSSMLTIALFYHHNTAITPTELSGKAPAPMKPAGPAFAPVPNIQPPVAPPANTVAPEVIAPPANTPVPVQAPVQAPAPQPVPAEPPDAPPPAVDPPPYVPPPVVLPPPYVPPVVLPPPVVIRPPTAPPSAPAPATSAPPPPRSTPKPPPSTPPPPPPSSAPPPPASHPPPATIYQRPR